MNQPETLYAEGPDDGEFTGHFTLGYGVKAVECRYKCGDYFIVTSRLERPPAHIECAIKRAVEHNMNIHNHTGKDWEKYLIRLEQWVQYELAVCQDYH